MNELYLRIKSGAWVAGALTFVLVVLELVVENADRFELSDFWKGAVIVLSTATMTQITKYLNNRISKK
jgi:hypothetical protein